MFDDIQTFNDDVLEKCMEQLLHRMQLISIRSRWSDKLMCIVYVVTYQIECGQGTAVRTVKFTLHNNKLCYIK